MLMEELLQFLPNEGTKHPEIMRPSETEWFVFQHCVCADDDDRRMKAEVYKCLDEMSALELQSHYQCMRSIFFYDYSIKGTFNWLVISLFTEWQKNPQLKDALLLQVLSGL